VSKDRRIGRFFVNEEFVSLDNLAYRRMMEKVVVLRAEFKYEQRAFEYYVLCEDFEEVPLNFVIPEYRVIVSRTGDGRVKIEWGGPYV
jgi:hypothetical protein